MLGFHPLASAPLGDDGAVVSLTQQGSASLVSSSSLAASAQTTASGAAALNGVGSASFAAELVASANVSLSSSGSLAAESKAIKTAATDLAAIGLVSFDSDLNAKGQVSLEAVGSIKTQVKIFASVSLSSAGSTLLVGERISFGATQLSGSGSVVFLEEFRHGGKFEPIAGNIGESSILIDGSVTLFTSEVYAKYLGTWEDAQIYVKNNGVWVEPVSAYQNINGSWKRIA